MEKENARKIVYFLQHMHEFMATRSRIYEFLLRVFLREASVYLILNTPNARGGINQKMSHVFTHCLVFT